MVRPRNAYAAAGIDEDAHVILTPEGEIELDSRQGRALASWTQIVEWLRSVARRDERAAETTIDGARIRAVRLEGAGTVRYLLTISRRSAPKPSLTRAQRAVAELAAVGATIPEIARHLQRSPETVRTHMREIYRRLDIASRVELVLVLRPA